MSETGHAIGYSTNQEVNSKPNLLGSKIAEDVKTYVKSVFGATSPQYRQVSGLAFKNVK
jgi:hypothetical protein